MTNCFETTAKPGERVTITFDYEASVMSPTLPAGFRLGQVVLYHSRVPHSPEEGGDTVLVQALEGSGKPEEIPICFIEPQLIMSDLAVAIEFHEAGAELLRVTGIRGEDLRMKPVPLQNGIPGRGPRGLLRKPGYFLLKGNATVRSMIDGHALNCIGHSYLQVLGNGGFADGYEYGVKECMRKMENRVA